MTAATDIGAGPPTPHLTVVELLDASERFHRDSSLGRVYHRGTRSYRELRPVDSLHVVIDGDRMSMHIDRISPVTRRSDGSVAYTLSRILAHNLVGIVSGFTRRDRRLQPHGIVHPDHSFIFRSPHGGLTAGAPSLQHFTVLAAVIDDETWLDHLHRGDYSRWFDEVIGDDALTQLAANLEARQIELSDDSRRQIITTIASRYPLSA